MVVGTIRMTVGTTKSDDDDDDDDARRARTMVKMLVQKRLKKITRLITPIFASATERL